MATTFSRRVVLLLGASVITALGGAVIIATTRREPRMPAGTPIAAADVPIGGGTVFNAHEFVVTQPELGEFQAFNSKCPHANCDVGNVKNGEIICYCHGSRFALDGSLRRGPARRGLKRRTVELVDDTLYVGDPA